MLSSRFVFRFGSAFGVLGAAFVVLGPGSGFVLRAQTADASLLARVGRYVERYYDRAQMLLATETIVVQPLARSMTDEAYAWRIVNELHIEPDSADPTQVTAVRHLLTAIRPALGSGEYGGCLDGRLSSPDPLAFLLPRQQATFRFTIGKRESVGGVEMQRVDYTALTREAPVVEWRERCGNIRSPGSTRGTVWVNAASGDVLRLEMHLIQPARVPGPTGPEHRGAPRSFRLERYDTTIDYGEVTFTDPDEVLRLPQRIESIQIVRNTGTPEVRVTRTFTNYRRFLTGGRAIID